MGGKSRWRFAMVFSGYQHRHWPYGARRSPEPSSYPVKLSEGVAVILLLAFLPQHREVPWCSGLLLQSQFCLVVPCIGDGLRFLQFTILCPMSKYLHRGEGIQYRWFKLLIHQFVWLQTMGKSAITAISNARPTSETPFIHISRVE